jgi:predicted component of type VI protein secretion system
MKTIYCVLVSAFALLLVACPSTGTNPAANGNAAGGLHGELSAGTTINPNDPNDISVNVGGKILFLKKKNGKLARDKQGHLQAVDQRGKSVEFSP